MTFEEWRDGLYLNLGYDDYEKDIAEAAWNEGRLSGIAEAREWTAREWADAPDKDDDLPENAGEMLWAMQGAPDKECLHPLDEQGYETLWTCGLCGEIMEDTTVPDKDV